MNWRKPSARAQQTSFELPALRVRERALERSLLLPIKSPAAWRLSVLR